MFSLRVFLLLASVFSIVGIGSCEFLTIGPKNPKETFVGPLEQTVKTLMKSGRMLNRGVETTRDNLRGVASLIPLFNIPREKSTSIGDVLNPFKPQIKAIFPGA